jgi:hypothetical protein
MQKSGTSIPLFLFSIFVVLFRAADLILKGGLHMDRKTVLKVVAISAGVFVALAAGTLGGLYLYGRNMGEEKCLANRIDAKWSQIGDNETVRTLFGFGKLRTRTEAEKRESRQQAEMIARIEILLSQDRKPVTLCPPDFGSWGVHAAWRQVVGAKADSDRWQIVSDIARKARAGNYEFPIPNYGCTPIEYKATKMRPSPRIRESDLRVVGKIGTMTVYCRK